MPGGQIPSGPFSPAPVYNDRPKEGNGRSEGRSGTSAIEGVVTVTPASNLELTPGTVKEHNKDDGK